MSLHKVKQIHGINSKGYTLMEIILAMVVIGLIGGFLAGILSFSGEAYDFIIKRNSIVKGNRQYQDRIFTELKSLDSLQISTATSIQWLKVNGDILTYTVDISGKITRQLNGGSVQDLTADVSVNDTWFAYYDGGGVVISPPPATVEDRNTVRAVEVVSTLVRGDQSSTLRRLVFLENLKYKQ